MTGKYHVACSICDDGIGMCGGVVKILMDYFLVFCIGFACCVARESSAGSMVLLTQCA